MCARPGCDLEPMREPRRSTLCRWHYLARLGKPEQGVWAARRAHENGDLERPPVTDPTVKWCSGCCTSVPLFYIASGNRCVGCAYNARRDATVARTYGLDPEDHRRLLEAQGSRCAICGTASRRRALAVDHDHRTGLARGLLCTQCNHDLIGGAREDVRILRAAVAYLEAPPASVLGIRAFHRNGRKNG